MPHRELDAIDRGILHLLHQDARNNTNSDIAERVGTSSSTVGNRIRKLENDEIITGYQPTIDYDRVGYDDHSLVIGSAPYDERENVVNEIISVPGVVSVRELLTNKQNISAEVVSRARSDIEQAMADFNEIGLDIGRIEMLKRERSRPFNHWASDLESD